MGSLQVRYEGPAGAHSGEAADAEGRRENRRGWFAVAIFLMLYTLGFLDRQILALLVDPISRDLQITDFQISILSGGAFVLFYVLCAVPIGWAVDRFSRRWIIFCGVGIWSLCTTLSGFAGTYMHLLLCRFGVGAGEAALAPGAYSMLSDLFRKERLTGALAVFSTGATIGGALSFALGGAIIAMASDTAGYALPLVGEVRPWQLVFFVAGVPGIALAFSIFLIREPVRKGLSHSASRDAGRSNAERPKASVLSFMRRHARFYAAHFIGFGLFNLMSAGALIWIPTYLIRDFGLPVPRVGLILGVGNLLCCTAGMLFSGYFTDHLFRKGIRDAHLRYYAWLVGIAGLFGLLATLSSNLILVFAGFAVFFFICPFIAVAAAALQITTPNEYRGQVSAIFLFVYNVVGYGAGPSIIAGLSDFLLGGGAIGLSMALTFAVFTPLAVLAFWWGLAPMRRAVAESARRDARDDPSGRHAAEARS